MKAPVTALNGITFHEATRKTAATRIILSGGSLVTAKNALGHSDIQTTMDYIGITKTDVSGGLERAANWALAQEAERNLRPTFDQLPKNSSSAKVRKSSET